MGSLRGQTGGYVSRKPPAVRVSCITYSTLAVSGHWVGDTHWTSFNVCHLIGPVPVTDPLFSPIIMADVDRILSSTPNTFNSVSYTSGKQKVKER